MNAEFVRFALAGGVAAAVNILSRWLLSLFMRFEIAVVIAYLIGMATAFVLTRQFVFKRSDRHVRIEAMRFALVNLAALAQVWVISVGLAEWVLPWLGIIWQKGPDRPYLRRHQPDCHELFRAQEIYVRVAVRVVRLQGN